MDFKSERGASLIMVSALIVIILISSSALMMTAQQSVTISRLAVHRNQSLMNARDGVQLAEQHAQQLWPADPQSFVSSMNAYLSNLSESGAPFTASVTQNISTTANASSFTLKVIGSDKPYQKTLQVAMNATKAQVENPLFQYVAYSNESLHDWGNPSITGKTLIRKNISQWNSPPALLGQWPDQYNWASDPQAENDFQGKLMQYFSKLRQMHSGHEVPGGEHDWGNGHQSFENLFGSFFTSTKSTGSTHFEDLLPTPFQTVMRKNQTAIEQSAKQTGTNYLSNVINKFNSLPAKGGYINDVRRGWGHITFDVNSNQTVNGPLYINGSLAIEPGVTLTVNGPLYINGNLRVSGALQSASPTHSHIQKVFVSGFSVITPSQDLNSPFVLVSQGDIVVIPAAQSAYLQKNINNTGTTINAFLISGGNVVLSNGPVYENKNGFPDLSQSGTAPLTLHGGVAAEGNIYLTDISNPFSVGQSNGDSSDGYSSEGDSHQNGHDDNDGDDGHGADNSGSPTPASAQLNLVYDPIFLQNVVIPGLPTSSGSSQSSSSIHFTSPTTVTP